MDGLKITDEGGTTPGLGQAMTHTGPESMVRLWGGFDRERAWPLRVCLRDLAATDQRRITLDVSELSFPDSTVVAILVGALTRVRPPGAEVAVRPQSSGAYRVLKRVDLTAARTTGNHRP